MEETGIGRLDFIDQTVLHPLGLAAIILLGTAMLLLSRRYACLPMIIMACFIAPAQRIFIFNCNFNLLRIMVLFGWIRLVLWGESAHFRWTPLDYIILLCALVRTVAFTILFGSVEAFKFQLGENFDALGIYFMFRCLIRDEADIESLAWSFAMVSLPVAMAFLIENFTGQNLFAFLGGVPSITVVREGRLRCQGAFSHPILAGCFWASVMPLIGALWWRGSRCRTWAAIGLVSSGAIIWFCSSSTPIMAVLFGILGACFFPFRGRMRMIRWGSVLTLIGLHFIMQAPVWHLVARLDILNGSTGWHRYHLIDQTIRHFSEWWLVGTKSTVHWDEFGLLWDVTNQYVVEAIHGGILNLVLFMTLIVLAFSMVGRILQQTQNARDWKSLTLAWAIGVALFVHCMNFFAVAYFGQMIMVWYPLIAAIGSMSTAQSKLICRKPCWEINHASPRIVVTGTSPANRTARW